jgi:predicted TPR repeat methyltransferase
MSEDQAEDQTPEDQIEEYRRAIAAMQFNLGIALLQAGRFDEACESAEQAVRHGFGAMAEELLGAAHMAAVRFDDADEAFARAAQLAPERAGPWCNRALVARNRGDTELAIQMYREGLARVPDHVPALESLGALLHLAGDIEESLAIHDRILAIDPQHVAARHLAAAARGDSPPAPPDGFVAATYDGYAPRFEAHLVGDLGYRGPALLREALGDERATRALDLGCGTGLVGAEVRDLVDTLDGVDLSAGMIAEAQKRGIYHSLRIGDLRAYLEADGEPYDLIVSADVLIYFGDLAPVLAAAARRLAPRGRFAFTVEKHTDPDGWRLAPWARYVHGRAYVEREVAAAGLTVEHCGEASLRRERGMPVVAFVVIARKS